MIGLSKSNRTVASQDVIRLSNSNKDNVVIDLFVRKNKDDEGSKEFYYLGTMQSNGVTESVKMKSDTGNDVNAVEIHYILDQPVREDIYDYITT